MNTFNKFKQVFLFTSIFLTFSAYAQPGFYNMHDFQAVKKYDTHVHIESMDPAMIKQAKEDGFRLININGDFSSTRTIEEQQVIAARHVKDFPALTSYATTISVKNWNDKNWQKETLAYLKNSFRQGAVGVKVWKNIGMDLKDSEGKFVMIDHPKFDPILNYIKKKKITLFSHQGEPKNCWLPLDQMTVKSDRNYFEQHPQYHMYLHPDYPSYEEQIAARDRMLEKHPKLNVVSVHLASLEWSLDELARRLDKYPNLAVDMAARIVHIQNASLADRQKVIDFFIKYQDRILYGTDLSMSAKSDPVGVKEGTHTVWLNDWKYFATDSQVVTSNDTVCQGLRLPREVIDKIYFKNAENWIFRRSGDTRD